MIKHIPRVISETRALTESFQRNPEGRRAVVFLYSFLAVVVMVGLVAIAVLRG